MHTNLLRQRDPVAAGAVLLDVGLELGVLLRRPRPLLHARLVAARRSPHGWSVVLLDLLQIDDLSSEHELDLTPSSRSPADLRLRNLGQSEKKN